MQEAKKETESKMSVHATGRQVSLYLEGELFLLGGDWDWDLKSEAVFCSDVMMGWPADFAGTKAIIHPDDKEAVTGILKQVRKASATSIEYRIITTYGDVKWLHGANLFLAESESDGRFDPAAGWSRQEEVQTESARDLRLAEWQRTAYAHTSRILQAGAWYHNTTTGETWYSDEVYRLLDLVPQSINGHLNTLYPFVHNDDRKDVIEALEQSYRRQAPLHLQFRIITRHGTERWLEQATTFGFNNHGETMIYGAVQDISQQKEADQQCEYHQSSISFQKQLLHFAESATGIGYWQVNIITKKTNYSDNHYRLFGLKPQDGPASAATFLNLVHPDDRDLYRQVQDKIRKEHTAPEIDYRVVRPDGKIRYIRQKGKAVIGGGEILVVGTVQDMTAQKGLEKKLGDLQQGIEIKAFTAAQAEGMAGIGTWVWNLQTSAIAWSDNMYELIGLKQTAVPLTQKALLQTIHPDDGKLFKDELTLVLKERQETAFTFRLIRRGEVRHMRASFKLMAYGGQDLFIGTVQDLTSERMMVRSLSERIHLMELLADTIPDQVFVTDADNNVILWNRKCEETYGRKREKALGENFFDLLPALKQEAVIQRMAKVLAGEEIRTYSQKGKYTLRGWFNMTHIPLRGNGGAVNGILHLVRDVTGEHQLHEQLTGRLQFIERLLEVSVDRIVALDRNMNYLYWNKRAEEDFGLAKEKVIGKNILEVFPQTESHLSYADFWQALRGQTVHMPATEERKEESYLIPVRDEQGDITAVLWIQRDRQKDFLLKRQAQKALDIINALNENYLELDRECRVCFVNQQTLSFLAKTEEELKGRRLWDLYPQMVDTSLHIAIVHAMEERVTVRNEFRSPAHDLHLLVSIAPTVDGIAVAFSDISFLKEAEQKLAEEHRRLKEAQALGHVGSFEWTVGAEFAQWSDELYRINGMEPEDGPAIAQSVQDYIHPDDLAEFEKQKEASIAKAGRYGLVHRINRRDGGLRWINQQWESLADENGTVVRIRGVVQDITEQKAAEQELRLQTAFAQATVESSIDQITIFDKEERFLIWNKKAEEAGGMAKEDVIGKTIREVFPDIVNEPEFLTAQKKALGGEYVYIPAKRGLSSKVYQQWFYVPLKNEKGEPYAVLNIIHDISDKVAAEELLKQKNKELEAKNEEITNFAFIASHDLKEPIRKIHTFSNWLMEREADNLSIKGKEYAFKIFTAVERLDGLIEDIITLTKLQAIKPSPADLSLDGVLAEALAGLQDVVEETGAVIESKDLPGITGDRKQLVHLFRNLIDNAIKFQEPDVVPVIEIAAVQVINPDGLPPGLYLELSFTDNGIGFEEEYAEKIFRVFQRLHGQSAYPGSGIGLAICKKIMENHGGQISAHSAPGKGSVFTCWFPSLP